MPDRTTPTAPVSALGSTTSRRFTFCEPQTVYEDLDGRHLLVQLGLVCPDPRAEPGYRRAKDVEDRHEQQRHPEQHDHERHGPGNPTPSQPGVDPAEQEAQDYREEDGVEDRRGQAHPDEHDHRRGQDPQHPQEGGSARRALRPRRCTRSASRSEVRSRYDAALSAPGARRFSNSTPVQAQRR
jgi:hypothetical protein